ncbi:hypothetical protein ABZ023_25920 [Streptomyces sp. NPDC006367]|jgi:hypothetical protein|uniref:hypothetical protein n=1 Tax=unclassified Streptomyces TaxID=2593676 RepID=UPI0033AB5494
MQTLANGGAAAACFGLIVALQMLGRGQRTRRLALPIGQCVLMFFASLFTAGTGLGMLVNSMITWLNDNLIARFVGWLGVPLMVIVALGLLAFCVAQAADGNASTQVLGAISLLPYTAVFIPGTVGAFIAEAYYNGGTEFAGLITSWF